MSEKKGWGQTVLGWFVVREGDAAAGDSTPGASEPATSATDEDVIARAAASAPAAPAPAVFSGAVPAAPGGQVDFAAVFSAAGLGEGEQAHVARASELLRSLPAGIDAGAKRQIVEASLKAFGFPIESIIEAGVGEIQALEAYIQAGAAETATSSEDVAKKIAAFEDEIRRLRAALDEKVASQKAVIAACNAKKLEVQHVLEFFGQEAVAKVVRASPKLIDPAPAA